MDVFGFFFVREQKSKLKSLAHRGVRLRASAGQRRPRCASRSTVSLKSGVLLARVTSGVPRPGLRQACRCVTVRKRYSAKAIAVQPPSSDARDPHR